MNDIVERLRDSDTTRRIGESYSDVHDRRQADRDEAADEITRLTARVEELEGALERIDRIEVYDEDARETLRSKLGVMRDIARAALSASQPAPSPWRLIETAPTDGTVVLVFAAERDGLAAFQCTAAYHEDAGWCVDELREVTHWMPLPPAPQKESSGYE